MAAETLQLINSAAQVSSDAFNRIDRAMTNAIESNQRSGQFAVEMTAKTADAIEQARMHDASIEKMQIDSKLAGERLAMERAMMPLEAKSRSLEIQTKQMMLLRQKQLLDKQNADQIFSTYDDLSGRQILATGNLDHAKDYLKYKAQWQSHLMNGGRFDAVAFEKGLNQLNTQYVGKPGTANDEDWNPETQYLYESISPKLGRAYEEKNPVVKKNKNGMAVGSLTSTDTGFTTFWDKFGKLFTEEESGYIGAGRSAYQSNEMTIDKLTQENSKLSLYASVAGLPDEEVARTQATIKENGQKIDAARRQNNLMMANYSQGKYGVPVEEKEPAKSQEVKQGNTDLKKAEESPLGFKADGNIDFQGQRTKTKLSDIAAVAKNGIKDKRIEDTELRFLDLDWFSTNRQGNEPDDATKIDIRERIIEGIDSVGNIGDVITENKMDNLFKVMERNNKNSVSVPISDYTAELIGLSSYDTSVGVPVVSTAQHRPKSENNFISFGSKTGFNSAKAIIERAEKIKNLGDRQEALKELYAALNTAAISQSLNTSK